jgi:hypothetical protein
VLWTLNGTLEQPPDFTFWVLEKIIYALRFGDGRLIWKIKTFQHKQWLVISQNKDRVRYHGIFDIKKS